VPEFANKANERLRDGKHVFGTMVGFARDPLVMRYIADAGYHAVSIDMEHSSLGLETVADHLGMARACGLTPLVRLAETSREMVQRLMDLGALGVMIHDVERRNQVEEILEWTVGSKFAGRTGDVDSIRREFTVAIQIESKPGVENIDAILGGAGGGVDVVIVGRGDLSMSLGHPLDRLHPDVFAALREIVAGCTRNGVAAGMGVVSRMNEEETNEVVDLGFRWIDYATDRHILRRGLADGMRMMRAATGSNGV
jgi:2-keto-3-deoxy-L-rhamnonate aldolase RhmA